MPRPREILDMVCRHAASECSKHGRVVTSSMILNGLFLVYRPGAVSWRAALTLPHCEDETISDSSNERTSMAGVDFPYELHPASSEKPLLFGLGFTRAFPPRECVEDWRSNSEIRIGISSPLLNDERLCEVLSKMAEDGCAFTYFSVNEDAPSKKEVLELNMKIKRQTCDFTKKIKETCRKYGMNSREFADIRKEAFEMMSYITHAHDAERPIRHNVCVVPKAGSLEELELKLSLA